MTGKILLAREELNEKRGELSEKREEISERLDTPVSARPSLQRLTKADLFRFVGLGAFFVFLLITCIVVAPLVVELTEPDGLDRVIADVQQAGPLGVLVLLGMQFFQVVVALIPGEVVQIAAGMMFGPWLGAAIILVGCVISSAFIYSVVHRLGAPFVRDIIPERWTAKVDDFCESDKLEIMVFVLFLIPGLPKDVFTYIVPLTRINMSVFVLLSNAARMPGIVVSTFMASGLMTGDYFQSAILFAISVVLAVIAMIYREKIISLFKRREKRG